MAIEAENINWITIVASSAVISALVNVAWGYMSKHIDSQKEKEKQKLKINHIYLNIAFDLEDFSKECNSHIYRVENLIWKIRFNFVEGKSSNHIPIHLEFKSSPRWEDLPINFVSNTKALPSKFHSTDKWIFEQWRDYDIESDQAYELEIERAAFYGLEACNQAKKIRRELGIESSDIASYEEHFQTIIDVRKESFLKDRKQTLLIPELRSKFEADCAEVIEESSSSICKK